MTAAYPGPNNTYLLSHEATNNLIVAFSRNPKSFPYAEYVQIVPVSKQTGAWLKITAEEAARVVVADDADIRWGDGQEAPMHNESGETFEWQTYITYRRAQGFNLGDLTIEQASWSVLEMHNQIYAQQMMTRRTAGAHTLLATSGNWPSDQTATATVAGGGKWDVSTTTDLFIKKSLRYAAHQIVKATLGQVQPESMMLVISPDVAAKMSESQEVHQYLKESPFALAQIRGDSPSQNGKYGLPDSLYGYKIVIEDAVKVTNVKGATIARSFVCSGDEAYMLSRPGGLMGHYGSPSFASISVFMKEEMTVETKRDDDNRRYKGRIVEDYAHVFTAPAASFRFSDVIT